jgi:rhamnulose-1-phosphate aldolase/alcohol dehydrogenase
MQFTDTQLTYLPNLWKAEKADALSSEIDKLLYRSNLLGSDLRITNYGGGNTSCRTIEMDPLTQKPVEVMWIKGSGGDIGTLTRSGLAGLYVDKLKALKNVYRGLEHEDEMVGLFMHCLYDLNSKAPSIDTPLHAFLPFAHIDHLHPDAIIAIAASKNGEQITKELFEGQVAWVPWQRPGFDLALKLEKSLRDNPGITGIILGGHGLFTWGETAYECYLNSLSKIDQATAYIEDNLGTKRPVFGGAKLQPLPAEKRQSQAAQLAPVLRGLCSSHQKMVGYFTDADAALEFTGSADLDRLAALGTSCPDHFLRTKIRPLVLQLKPEATLTDTAGLRQELEPAFAEYRKMYATYYQTHKHPDSPAMRDPNPVILLWPGVGLFSFAKNRQTARVAAEFYINAINVMRGAEAISSYVALPQQEAFDIEYWLLEEAKLQRMPKEKSLDRRVAFITGGAGGIGRAIAAKFMQEGACVVVADLHQNYLDEAGQTLGTDPDRILFTQLNVSSEQAIKQAFSAANLAFGGVDIVVNCAGMAISKPLAQTEEKDWNLLQDVIVKGQFLVSQTAAASMKAQGLGGDIVNIASKNGLVSGPNNVAYGTAKAAQLHMSRLLAAELGPDKIRVNIVNPDAVITGSKIWEGAWAEGRAKAYNIPVEDLPKHYAQRTLLNEVISTEDIANATFAFVSGLLSKSTGNILNVDGGVAPAFPR